MKVKIGLARAYKAAKANGYTGPEEIEAVAKWFADNVVRDENGGEFEVVAEVKTITIKAEDDGDEPETKAAETDEIKRLREKARELDAIKGIQSSGINGVIATIHGGGASGYNAKAHERLAEKKAYNRRAGGNLRPGEKAAVWGDADEAEAFGAFSRLSIMGVRGYGQKSADLEIVRKANVTNDFTSGGALVPPGWTARLIDLRESYGVFEGAVQRETMSSDVQAFPRRTGNLTVYSPGEASTITESNMTFDDVEIIARKRAVLTTISNELIDDSAISMADTVANNIAWSFAKDIDERGFNGDGTSTYAGDVGIRSKILNLSSTRADIAGLVVGGGNLWSELTLANFHSVAGRLPEFVGATGEPTWYVNKRFWHEVMEKIAKAADGVTAAEIGGKMSPVFLGYAVKFARSMPRTEANDQVCAILGWPDLGAMMGTRKTIEIASSTDRYFEQDKIAFRGIQRAGITVHDVGNASATESSREPGPIVGLLTAAS